MCDDGVHTLAFGHSAIPPEAVAMEGEPPMYDDEMIAPLVPLDRAMPDLAPYVPPDLVDLVLEASLYVGEELPLPPPELAGGEYEVVVNHVADARAAGVAPDVLRPRIQAVIDAHLNNDNAAWVMALLDLV